MMEFLAGEGINQILTNLGAFGFLGLAAMYIFRTFMTYIENKDHRHEGERSKRDDLYASQLAQWRDDVKEVIRSNTEANNNNAHAIERLANLIHDNKIDELKRHNELLNHLKGASHGCNTQSNH